MFECYVFKALLRRRFGVQMQAELGRRGHRAVGEYGAALATPWSRRRRLEGWVREEAWEKKVHAEKESSCSREGRKKKSCRPHLRLRLPHATPHCCLPSPTIHPPLLHVPFLLLALCCMRALPCSGARGKRLTTQIWEESSIGSRRRVGNFMSHATRENGAEGVALLVVMGLSIIGLMVG
jgi:hypothetical protein